MPAPIIIGAIIAGAITLIGKAIEAGQRGEAQKIREDIAQKYGDIAVAQLDKALVNELPPSALNGIVEDKTLREAQLGAIRGLENEYETGGQSDGDIASLRLVQQDAAQAAAGNQADVEGNLARRGQASGPLGAALAMQAGQNAANATGRAGMQFQADARMRALRALEGMGNLAGNVRGQDYRVASDKARAQDELNRYNADSKFKTLQYNNSMAQQSYQDRMQKLTAQGNARMGVAAGQDANADRTGQAFGGLASTASGLGTSLDEYYYPRDKDKKGGS